MGLEVFVYLISDDFVRLEPLMMSSSRSRVWVMGRGRYFFSGRWRHQWAGLYRATGGTPWQPDVLRHTFATHHLATFRNYAELQLEMGHRSAELLRTRYVAMEGFLRYRKEESMLAGMTINH